MATPAYDSQAQLQADIAAVQFGIVDITPGQFASYVEKFVHFGSKRYVLSKEDITVYAMHAADFDGKKDIELVDFKTKKVPKTLDGHLKNGTKFLDAVLWMHLPDDEKPTLHDHDDPPANSKVIEFDKFDDLTKIAKMMFFFYFYVLTRARAPEQQTGSAKQPVPRFLSQVLSIPEGPGAVAEYLASFKLTDLDPAWVRGVQVAGMSREALARFGLGVAGYRQAAPFKLQDPDAEGHAKYANAVKVARSFAEQPACWDFHPATRNPNVLTKYGNVNKNLGNLMLKVYKTETLEKMVAARIIFALPTEDPTHTNFVSWTEQQVYATSAPVFPSQIP